MLKLIWFLAKIFVAIALSAVFGKWFIHYLGIHTIPLSGDPLVWALTAIIASVTAVIGLSAGLIWGEENAYRNLKKRISYD